MKNYFFLFMIFIFLGCDPPLPEPDISITKNSDPTPTPTPTSTEILGHVSTFAGKAVYGGDDGPLKDAGFFLPKSIAYHSSGNLYVIDFFCVRKINPSGIVSTFAGSVNQPGSTDGIGTEARFYYPSGIAIDSSDNLFVADTSNHTIRKITPSGVVTTLSGAAGTSGSADGTGPAARFNQPWGMTIDGSDNLYVTDVGNYTIRKITPTGFVTILAGAAGFRGNRNGTGHRAWFHTPRGITIDQSGDLFVVEEHIHLVRKITSVGVVTTFAGQADVSGNTDGTGTSATFFRPRGITIDDAGNLFVTDSNNYSIRKITPAAVVTTFAGQAGVGEGWIDGTGSNARFSSTNGIVMDSSGNLIVADTYNKSLRSINSLGVVTTLTGPYKLYNGTGSAARFVGPTSLALDSNKNVFVADPGNHTIRKITPAGVVTTFAGQVGITGNTDATGIAARFKQPYGIAIDRSNNLFVTDSGSHTIRKITPAGVVTTFAGKSDTLGSDDGTGEAARFNSPQGITIDAQNNLYIGDTNNFTIRKITPTGVVTTVAGNPGNYGHVDGTGAAAQFYNPLNLTTDHEGNIFVADCDTGGGEYSYIRKITPTGDVITVAGGDNTNGLVDGPGLSASFSEGFGIVSDGAGNLYVADTYFHSIRKLDSNYNVTTFAGSSTRQFGRTDGQGSEATFMNPRGIAFDSSGALYIADLGNRNIRKID